MKTDFFRTPEPELSGPALAQYFDVQPSTVRWWRRQGAPAIIYNPKLIRYRISEIQAWLRKRGEGKGKPTVGRRKSLSERPAKAVPA